MEETLQLHPEFEKEYKSVLEMAGTTLYNLWKTLEEDCILMLGPVLIPVLLSFFRRAIIQTSIMLLVHFWGR
jgi:hypothetical protein